ncbi:MULTISPECIES: YhfT family protein [Oceanobacillus]|uniref:Transporter n=1 Tax=Oceanobacillus neutriphilus TaxID=531815 RepID=A0ABQ2NPG2_9BACI|nr:MULTISPECIES: YhfT family protein [Oceanobacillus]GGP07616.1 transporter [Oceanobacillus neutriphilus]
MESEQIIKFIIFAIMGGYSTFLVNKTIAVYHDGLRPIMPEFINGNMSRKELAGISFAISIGFITGFAMPITLATGIIVIHIILLTSDIVGTSIANTKIATITGFVCGGFIPLTLDFVVKGFEYLPVNFLDALAAVGDPIIFSFVAFPAVAVAYQFGKKKGLITFILSVLGRVIVERVNPIYIADNEVSLSPEGIAMLIGMFCLIFFAAKDKTRGEDTGEGMFEENVKRIRKNIYYLIPMGAIIAVAANYQWLAGEPIAGALLGKGEIMSAALVAFIQAIAFMPLVITTALVSGVYNQNGWNDWILGLGYISANPFIAVLLGAGAMAFEVLSLRKVGGFLNKFPALKMSGDNIRTAMVQILEIALLVGGINAGNLIWEGTGLFMVVALYILNEISGKPVMRLAAGPIAAIVVGVVANILALTGLFIQ